MSDFGFYNVVHTDRFLVDGEAIAGDAQRWDEMVEGVMQALQRKPEYYPVSPLSPSGRVRVAPLPLPPGRKILVLYTIEVSETERRTLLQRALIVSAA